MRWELKASAAAPCSSPQPSMRVLLLAALCAGLAAAQTIPVAITEEERCNATGPYTIMVTYELDQGLLALREICKQKLRSLKELRFGPPSQWELFNQLCKTACRGYYDRWLRITSVSDCDCTKFVTPPLELHCPPTPNDLMCEILEVCYDAEFYQTTFCDNSACGRLVTNEDEWRACSSSWAQPSLVLTAVLAAAAALLLRGG